MSWASLVTVMGGGEGEAAGRAYLGGMALVFAPLLGLCVPTGI